MYAIIETGGKQYKVTKGMIIEVEKLPVEADTQYSFDQILLVSDGDKNITIGQPYIEGASVAAKVVAQDKDKKVVIFKYKRKTNYNRKTGHRQPLTRLQIEEIKTGLKVGKVKAADKTADTTTGKVEETV